MLYTYCLRFDDGAAPNPYWGVCTLVICKPVIRRTAKVGDWVVGLGSANESGRDLSRHVIYAMQVTQKLELSEYDTYCGEHLPGKFPDLSSQDFRRRVGDCIYDYAHGEEPFLRPSVHNEPNRKTDLGGENALLSDHFYYFGTSAIELPECLRDIAHPQQGHKSHSNTPFQEPFIAWIGALNLEPNVPHGDPRQKPSIQSGCVGICADPHREASEHDELCH
jgi:hypothetical protein